MVTPEKIEEWLKEVEERPGSAPLILQYIANRLRELSTRNEALLEENIALIAGKRVEEYEKRIAYLEYQLDLLRRQLSGEQPGSENAISAELPIIAQKAETISLLIYDPQGRVLRLPVQLDSLADGKVLFTLEGISSAADESLRLLAVSSSEELLCVFTSGRAATLPVTAIPLIEGHAGLHDHRASSPSKPRAGETLANLAAASRMSLAEYFIQVSRRGFVKKIMASMAQSILSNAYIGAGVELPADKTFETLLCGKEDRLALVSWEGYLMCVEMKKLPFSIEEVMRLKATDHLVTALIPGQDRSLLVMTQVGKAILFAANSLEIASSLKTRGQPVFSQQRREKGVRVIGAVSCVASDWGFALHQDGQVTCHAMSELFGAGTIPVNGALLAFTVHSGRTGQPF
ncbi:MAG: hypothetical protein JXB15_10210 [Anaerolineales bacterium]|nr:hypothetical protein [Anaerolineales bacterium]